MPPITLGLEEELQVVDPRTFELCAHDVLTGQKAYPDRFGTTSGETHRCILEVQTPVCKSALEVVTHLQELRRLARERAHAQGQLVLSAAMHPFADWTEQQMLADPLTHPHYARSSLELRDLVQSMLVFGTHVHLGVPDARMRIPVLNGLREVLPLVLALSASSPFSGRRDTGLDSWRHSLLDRLPRMGISEPWANEDAYWTHVKMLQDTRCIAPGFNLWGDIRLHHVYPTVEVRVLDAMPRLSRNWLVVTLLHLEAQRLVEQVEAGTLLRPLERELINENKWRARRWGLQAHVVDWRSGREEPIGCALQNWVDRLLPLARQQRVEHSLERELDAALWQGTSAQEQRVWFAHSLQLEEVVRRLHAQTEASWELAV